MGTGSASGVISEENFVKPSEDTKRSWLLGIKSAAVDCEEGPIEVSYILGKVMFVFKGF